MASAREGIRIRCFAGKDPSHHRRSSRASGSIPPTRTATRTLPRTCACRRSGSTDRTLWVYTVTVYKSSQKRSWPATDADVSVQVQGESDPRNLGRTPTGFVTGSVIAPLSPDQITFTISATDGGRSTPPSIPVKIEGYATYVYVAATLVIPTTELPPPFTGAPEGVPIEMDAGRGLRVLLRAGRRVLVHTGRPHPLICSRERSATRAVSGRRSPATASSAPVRPLSGQPPRHFAATRGRFQAVQPCPKAYPQYWHYADAFGRYYLRAHLDLLVVSDRLGIVGLLRIAASSASPVLHEFQSVTDGATGFESQFARASPRPELSHQPRGVVRAALAQGRVHVGNLVAHAHARVAAPGEDRTPRRCARTAQPGPGPGRPRPWMAIPALPADRFRRHSARRAGLALGPFRSSRGDCGLQAAAPRLARRSLPTVRSRAVAPVRVRDAGGDGSCRPIDRQRGPVLPPGDQGRGGTGRARLCPSIPTPWRVLRAVGVRRSTDVR